MAWVDSAKYSRFGPLVRFAYGLQKDVSAINAAVETSWSTGQVQGSQGRSSIKDDQARDVRQSGISAIAGSRAALRSRIPMFGWPGSIVIAPKVPGNQFSSGVDECVTGVSGDW
jgi:hypothetical protein